MKTVILYYTLGGNTKKEAERLSAELGASLCRVKEKRNRSVLSSFIPGCLSAMSRKVVAIKPLNINLNEYDRIVIGCPVWAGHPAPAFNSIVKLLPEGKEVELFFCSGSGDSQKSEPGTKELVENRGCIVTSLINIRTDAKPSKLKE